MLCRIAAAKPRIFSTQVTGDSVRPQTSESAHTPSINSVAPLRTGMQNKRPSIFRSEDVQHVSIMLHPEVAYAAVKQIGLAGCVQFIDINDAPMFTRPFVPMLRRCDEMLRMLKVFEAAVSDLSIRAEDLDESELSQISRFDTGNMDVLQQQFEDLLTEVNHLKGSRDPLISQLAVVRLRIALLEVATELIDDVSQGSGRGRMPNESQPLLDLDISGQQSVQSQGISVRIFGFVSGVIDRSRREQFERMLFRVLRGNILIRSCKLGAESAPDKDGVVVMFNNSGSNILKSRIEKVFAMFQVEQFQLPESINDRLREHESLRLMARDLNQVIKDSGDRMAAKLKVVAARSDVLRRTILIEKSIYLTLNGFSIKSGSERMYTAEAWVPVADLPLVDNALKHASVSAGSQMQCLVTPITNRKLLPVPTHFRSSEFTAGFQGVIDAYGMATYKELNPAVFAVVSFPFLFAVMYGDTAHGSLLTAFGLLMVLRGKQFLAKDPDDDILGMAVSARWVLLLMGVFAVYMGFIYNETLGIGFDYFGTAWQWACSNVGGKSVNCGPKPTGTYSFGLDPVWGHAGNHMAMVNSVKMKMAVILGVVQMLFGIALKACNSWYKNDKRTLLFECIPEALFLTCTFGYMDAIIFYKWSVDWVGLKLRAPSILDTMVQFFLCPGCDIPKEKQLFAGQAQFQTFLLLLALACIPVILVVKPYLIKRDMNGRVKNQYGQLHDDHEEEGEEHAHDDHGHGEDFQEIAIHQLIHTIEYVLGSISNTASYLRLWALSLAHAQLAEVFFEKGFLAGLEFGVFPLFLACGAFMGLTLGVLLAMETLSAVSYDLCTHLHPWTTDFPVH
jgi:V-type H+-transporting ATPase subunit a